MKFAHIALLSAALATTIATNAQQSYADALASIESNNPTLRAIRQETDAQKAQSATSRKMPDLEVELGYLWPGRKDVSASQPLDWSVMSGQSRRLAEARDSLAESQYAASRQEILLDARLTLIEATYQTALTGLRSQRAEALGRIALCVSRRLDAGDARQMDANNATMAYASASRQLTLAQADLDDALIHLKALNGGEPLLPSIAQFPPAPMPADFDSWYARAQRLSPQLMSSAAQASIARGERRQARMNAAPQLSVGFMGEFSQEEKYKGVTLGISLPLWRSRQTRDAAAHAEQAATSRHNATVLNDRAQAEAAWNRALQLGEIAKSMRQAVTSTSNADLLAKALEAGQISVSECLAASAILFEAEEDALSAERDYQVAVARLTACEL